MIEELNPFFNTFDPKSKVWIFQADRLLTDKEIVFLTEKGTDFTKQWKAHGADLKAGCTVEIDCFTFLYLMKHLMPLVVVV